MGSHSVYLSDGKKGGQDIEAYVKRRKINLSRFLQEKLLRDMDNDPEVLGNREEELQAELEEVQARKISVLNMAEELEVMRTPVREQYFKWWMMKFKRNSADKALKFAREMIRSEEATAEFAAVQMTPDDFEEWALAEMESRKKQKRKK